MIKIILINSGLMLGGGQRVVADLAELVKKVGMKNIQVCILGKKITLFDPFKPIIVDYDGRYNRIDTLMGTAMRLRHLLHAEQPAILHTHGWDADIIGWMASRGMKIRQVVHIHVMLDWLKSKRIKHRVRRWLTRLIFRDQNVFPVAVSAAVQRYWAKYLPMDEKTIRIIRNGIDVERFQPAVHAIPHSSEVPIIGVAARLSPMKGIEYLLDALGILNHHGIKFKLKVAGEGNYRTVLEQRARDAGITQQICFLGYVENMPAFYQSIDLFVLPSFTEGFPLSVLEAMATGIPVVASAVGGIPEILRDEIDGFLFPSGDTVALSVAIQRMIGDKDLRQRMAQNARQRIENEFPLERFFCKIIDFYRKILKENSA